MKKRWFSLLLAGAFTASMLSGCGAAEENVGGAGETASSEGNEDGGSADEAEDEEWDGESDEVVVALLTFTPLSTDQTDPVEERLNEILEEKLHVHADFQWMDVGTYSTAVPMMIQANEQLDLMMYTPIPSASFSTFMGQNQLQDITALLPENAPDVYDIMKDYLAATSRNGKVYGVSNLMCMESTLSLDMRKDVMEEAGVLEEAQNFKSWDEVEEAYKKGVEASGITAFVGLDSEGSTLTMPPFISGAGNFSDAVWVDTIGEGNNIVYADPADNKVKCYFENEVWQDTARLARKYYNEGLIYKDALTSQENGVTLIRGDVGFAQCSPTELGEEAVFLNSTGYEDVHVPVVTCKLSTGTFQKFGYVVPVNAQNPEAALKLLNLMWTDQEFMDTLTWGVEGSDWVLNDNGMADYPEGADSTSVYHMQDFMFGNTLQITPWAGDDPDVREHAREANANLEASPFFGFAVDSTPVTNEIVAVKNVVDQYKPGLMSGSLTDDVDGKLQEFVDELYAAGMQDILDEYQSQLDAWLAEQ